MSTPSLFNAQFRTRLISATVLVAITAFALFYHRHSFAMLLIIGGFMALKEWRGMNVQRRFSFTLLTGLYTAAALCALWWLREQSTLHVLCLFCIVWSADSAGYIIGKTVGGPLCWPNISPKKTWSGTLAALLVGSLIGSIMLTHYLGFSTLAASIIAGIAAAASIGGDALESHLKRRADVKDSGTLIPGHGGLLDRIDALLAASIVFAGGIALSSGL